MVVIAEYVWFSGAHAGDIRSKSKTCTDLTKDSPVTDFPEWNFDGSSTEQALGLDTEILIRPVRKFPHPFIKDFDAVVILADCYNPNGTPAKGNYRFYAKEIFEAGKDQIPWFGLEQEYVIYKDGRPFNWPNQGFPEPQGKYYCSNGDAAWGRDIANEHHVLSLKMGLTISGTNAEVMPSQWEYQVGPCVGIDSGDEHLMARWVLIRVAEKYGCAISFACKPVHGNWNGSGCHTNFSTAAMRAPGGLTKIMEAIERLGRNFNGDIPFYGTDNNQRLSGHHETSKVTEFSHGVGTRHTSVRIPNETAKNNRGYFEDRRPAGDIDAYLVTSRLFSSSCGIDNSKMNAVKFGLMRWWMKDLSAHDPNSPVKATHTDPKMGSLSELIPLVKN